MEIWPNQPRWAKVIGSIGALVGAVVGLAGVPEDVRAWWVWLESGVPWWFFLVASAVLLFLVWAPSVLVWWRRRIPSSTELALLRGGVGEALKPSLHGTGTTTTPSKDDLLERIRERDEQIAEKDGTIASLERQKELASLGLENVKGLLATKNGEVEELKSDLRGKEVQLTSARWEGRHYSALWRYRARWPEFDSMSTDEQNATRDKLDDLRTNPRQTLVDLYAFLDRPAPTALLTWAERHVSRQENIVAWDDPRWIEGFERVALGPELEAAGYKCLSDKMECVG